MSRKETHENRAPYPIRIDREGVWYYLESEMIRKDIIRLFYDHLHKDDTGEYFIEMGVEQCFIEVEDTPYVVRAVYKISSHNGSGEYIRLMLNDLSVEDLDPASLRIGTANVPYCDVREGRFSARFSRAGYYQIAECIEHDQKQDTYYIELNGNRFYLEKPEESHDKRQD